MDIKDIMLSGKKSQKVTYYDSIYITFLKWQNYSARERIGGFQRLVFGSTYKGAARESFFGSSVPELWRLNEFIYVTKFHRNIQQKTTLKEKRSTCKIW